MGTTEFDGLLYLYLLHLLLDGLIIKYFYYLYYSEIIFPNSQYRMKNYWFYLYSILSICLFLFHTKLIWGIYTLL